MRSAPPAFSRPKNEPNGDRNAREFLPHSPPLPPPPVMHHSLQQSSQQSFPPPPPPHSSRHQQQGLSGPTTGSTSQHFQGPPMAPPLHQPPPPPQPAYGSSAPRPLPLPPGHAHAHGTSAYASNIRMPTPPMTAPSQYPGSMSSYAPLQPAQAPPNAVRSAPNTASYMPPPPPQKQQQQQHHQLQQRQPMPSPYPPQQQMHPPTVAQPVPSPYPPQQQQRQPMPSPYPPQQQMHPPTGAGHVPMHGRPLPPATAYERPKIDVSQIPRPPLFTRPQSNTVPVYRPRLATSDISNSNVQPPPPADSRFFVQDDGNASPDIMRSSVHAFPASRGTWHDTGDLPLGVLISPMAVHAQDFVPRPRILPDGSLQDWNDTAAVPLVQSSSVAQAPARCGQCLAYLNPFFGADGTCNLCGSKNYRIRNAVTGIPVQYGTVDYEVQGRYVTRSRPVEPIQIYAVDLTCTETIAYLPILAQLGQDMAYHFWRQQEESALRPRMGVCLVSSAGIVVKGHDNNGRYTVMSDVTEEPFSPLPLEEWTFDLSTQEGLQAWKTFVMVDLANDMVHLKAQAREKNAYGLDGLEVSCGGAALAFLAHALSETGGRGTLITWRRPNFGAGSIPHREERDTTNIQDRNDYALYTPLQLQTGLKSEGEESAAIFYKGLGKSCAKDRVSIDVLVHNSPLLPQLFLDLATLGELCRVTCGKLSWINTKDWKETFYEELSRQLQVFSGWDAVFKVRCSDGIQVKSFVSNTGTVMDGLIGSLELELTAVTPSTCVAVELDHRVGGISSKSPFVFVQSALLYSALTGKRRMRVTTLALRTTSVVNDVYRSVDFGTAATLLLREAALRLREPKSEDERITLRTKTREMVYHRCILILACYRQHTPAKTSPLGQLLLPEKFQLLPLFCMSLLKSPMLRSGIPRQVNGVVKWSPSGDERAYFNFHMAQTSPATTMLMVHPNIFSIANVDDGVGEWNASDIAENHGFVKMPGTGLPSMESLQDDGIYLIDSGLTIYLYVGKLTPPGVKQQLLSDSNVDLKSLVDRLVWQMRAFSSVTRGTESELRPNVPPLVTVIEQEGRQTTLEQDVLNLMVDDGMAGEKDYVEFLCSLHRRIRERIENK